MLKALTLNLLQDGTAANFSTSDIDINSLVEHVDSLSGLDDSLCDSIMEEIQTLGLKKKGRGVKTQWLSPTSDEYNYGNVINKPLPIRDYPSLCKLMDIVNSHPSTTGDMDSCLVTRYPSNKSALRLHKDQEPLISQTSSICTVSLGAPRELSFFLDSKGDNVTPDLVLPATHRTMNIMKPGAQSKMKHAVLPADGDDVMKTPNVRFSLSFRKITPAFSNVEAKSPPSGHVKKQPKKNVVLVAGDSFAARLDAKLLGKNKQDVRNIAIGGRKIPQVQKDIEDFVSDNPDLEVSKLFVSVGANDIRYCENGIRHLKGPVSSLMRSIKTLLPGTKVWFQSIPPINPNGSKFTEINVLQMNNLLYNMCSKFKLFYLDIFPAFLNTQGGINSSLFPKYDTAKKLFDIHPNRRGMGVLARFYIYIIHSKWFNPFGY